MKAAVTGASGFIGSEVLCALARYPELQFAALTRKKKDTDDDAVWVETDYSVESLTEVFHGVDVVIHLAAVRGTGGKLSDYHANEDITENILLAMAQVGVKKIVFASSIAVYSDTDQIPWKESDALTPKTLYGITKASCENLCAYYAKKFGFSYIILRLAQVLGENESRRGMMNAFMDQAARREQLCVTGKSLAKRQFIYVRDLADLFAQAAVSDRAESVILNVGMQEACGNLEIAQIVNRVFENDTPICYKDEIPETIESSCMDVSRLKEWYGVVPGSMEQALTDIRRRMRDVQEGN